MTGSVVVGGEHARQVRGAARAGDEDRETAVRGPTGRSSSMASGVRWAETTRTSSTDAEALEHLRPRAP